MSEVYSFRLSERNPREAQAREVIDAWVKQGYSLRYILTEGLLRLGDRDNHADRTQMSDISKTVERLTCLVDRLEGKLEIIQPSHQTKSELSESFLSSIKMGAKPGLRGGE